ncbi:MAG: DMT family transporter [Oscillospiraceae bacterium]|nr:DMT family transporter [Oscillospiraceae bacterium]
MSRTHAKLLLISVFIARGTSFLFSKNLLQSMQPMSILAVRFTLAFLVLAIVFFKKLRSCSRESFIGGLILGLMYTVCMVFEMYGLRMVDTGVSSLIENMAIVLVPIYAAILTKTMPQRKTMVCAVIAVIGVGFLSLAQNSAGGSKLGIGLIILAAMTYAGCIIVTEKVSRGADPIAIGMIQLGTMGALSLLASLALKNFSLPQTGSQWAMMLMLVLVCSCFGFAFQPVGQKYVPAESAAVFTVVNPFTASIMGITIAGESISTEKMIGYVLILSALILYNTHPKQKKLCQ